MVRIEIKKAGINGEGIGFYKRKPVFVEGCFPSEIVECELSDEGCFYRGKILKIIRKSTKRIKAPCGLSRICGACRLMEVDYQQQLDIKKQLLRDALYKYCGYEGEIQGVVGSEQILHYRNKCNLPIIEHDGVLINALYRQGSNHPVLLDDCLIHETEVERIRKQVLQVLNKHHLPVYKNSLKKGLRQLIVRGFADEYQLVLVSGNDVFSKELISDLKQIDKLVSFYQGINTQKNPVNMMPPKLKKIFGQDKIRMTCGDFALCLSPQAFFQLNRYQAERIYSDVRELASDQQQLIVEAYCGIGAISLYLHDKAEKLIGVEIIEKAIRDACSNCELNGINNIEFIADDAGKAIRKIARSSRIDILVADPPRTGMDEELLETIIRSRIDKIIYISCNPATLGKDLAVLQKKYQIDLVRAYDMFPQTPHVETVALLSKLSEAKYHIEVKVDMDELDLTTAESKAEYEEIQDWVQKKYGFHVSRLNIAQVKRKYGIIERENYNKPKSPDSRQPGCTEEKVKAIVAALKHFQMI